jgi:hypothetical protein
MIENGKKSMNPGICKGRGSQVVKKGYNLIPVNIHLHTPSAVEGGGSDCENTLYNLIYANIHLHPLQTSIKVIFVHLPFAPPS